MQVVLIFFDVLQVVGKVRAVLWVINSRFSQCR
jgi:hypothetical protein